MSVKNSHYIKMSDKIILTLSIESSFNPLAANDEYTRFENLIFLWSWTPRTTYRSSATHAPGSSLISTDASTPSPVQK